MRCAQRRERLDQQVEPLLRLEPADRADDEVVGRDAERRRARRLEAPIAPERAVVDAVEHDADAIRPRRRGGPAPTRISLETAIVSGNARSTRLSSG